MTILKSAFLGSGTPKIDLGGCVLYLPLWQPDMAGSTIISKDKSANSCTVTGAVWGSQGRTFDGINDVITCGSAITIPATASTYCLWIKDTDAGVDSVRRLISAVQGAGYRNLSITDHAGGHKLSVYDGTNLVTATTDLADSIWHFVTVIHQTNNVLFYIDGVSDAVTDTAVEYITGDDEGVSTYAGATTYWIAQTLPTVGAFPANKVKLLMYREGSPGTVTVSIRATASNVPDGADLTSGTTDGDTLTTGTAGEWRETTLTPYMLSATTKYAVVVRCANNNASNRLFIRDDSTPAYADGSHCYSSDSGASWTENVNKDWMFSVRGSTFVLNALTATVTVSAAITPFGGVIGDVLLYTRALAVSEMVSLYQSTKDKYK